MYTDHANSPNNDKDPKEETPLGRIVSMFNQVSDWHDPAKILAGIKDVIEIIDPNWKLEEKQIAIVAIIEMGKQLIEIDPFVEKSKMELLANALVSKFQEGLEEQFIHKLPLDRTDFATPSILEALLYRNMLEKSVEQNLNSPKFNLRAVNFVARLGIIAWDSAINDFGTITKATTISYGNEIKRDGNPTQTTILEEVVRTAALIRSIYDIDQQRPSNGLKQNEDIKISALLLAILQRDPTHEAIPTDQIKHWEFIADQIETIVKK